MIKKTLIVAAMLIASAAGYRAYHFFVAQRAARESLSEFSGKIVLLRKDANGVMRETGVSAPYDITGSDPGPSIMRLSPDKTKVVYSAPEKARFVVYVASVDGSGVKKVAEPVAVEGGGRLVAGSIRWSADSSSIIYDEYGRKCNKVFCASPQDFDSVQTTYRVNVNTGEKSVDGAYRLTLMRRAMSIIESEFSGKIVLLRKDTNGAMRETGVNVPYDVTGSYLGASVLWLSPDKTKVVYSAPENAHVVIYVANVDGSSAKKVAEGGNDMVVGLNQWSRDFSSIVYAEYSSTCVKFPCDTSYYCANIATGEKVLWNQSTECGVWDK